VTHGNERDGLSRRDLVKVAAAFAATAAASPLLRAAGEPAATAPASRPAAPLPTRPLGKTGVKVTMLGMGGSTELSPRLLEHACNQGVRYFDTAASYSRGKSEQAIGEWLGRSARRKEVFLVTKNGTKQPKDLLAAVDARLKALQTDYIDAYFLHGLGGPQGAELARSPETRQVAEQLKKSGKIRFFGFSCHAPNAPDCLTAAAEGGFVDAIMMAYSPVTAQGRDQPFDRALDACRKAGIGLIAMKSTRGMQKILDTQALGSLNVHQAAIQAVLSDERIAAVCSEMENFTQIDQNTQAVRLLRKPMDRADVDRLRDLLLAGGLTYCPGCPACRRGILSRHACVQDILRYLSYYEQDGKRAMARAMYRAIPPQARDVAHEDLAAASAACALRVDYPALLARARRTLA
jgi:aryl-alcohol dehydrogenase-like predicted oxidoreductase